MALPSRRKYTAPEGSPSRYSGVPAPTSRTSAVTARSWKNPSPMPENSSNSCSPSSLDRCSTARQRAPGIRVQDGGAFSPYNSTLSVGDASLYLYTPSEAPLQANMLRAGDESFSTVGTNSASPSPQPPLHHSSFRKRVFDGETIYLLPVLKILGVEPGTALLKRRRNDKRVVETIEVARLNVERAIVERGTR